MTDGMTPTGRDAGRGRSAGGGATAPARRGAASSPAPSPEVRGARRRYVALLRAQVRAGTYLSDRRVEAALDRWVRAAEQDLPPA